jgi:hypothetical protein
MHTLFDNTNDLKDSTSPDDWRSLFHTHEELAAALADSEDRRRWGIWRLETSTWELVNEETHYRIDLERCTTSAALLDWIFQINGKGWGPKAMADLIDAFDDIFYPQENLCSGCLCGGVGKQIDATAYLRARYKKRRGASHV